MEKFYSQSHSVLRNMGTISNLLNIKVIYTTYDVQLCPAVRVLVGSYIS